MPRHRPPSERPTKACATCGRPMRWRKKWERVWDEVRHCSDACRKGTPRGAVSGSIGREARRARGPKADRRP